MVINASSRVRTCAFFRILELKSSALDHSAIEALLKTIAPAGNRTRVAQLGTVHDNLYTTGAVLFGWEKRHQEDSNFRGRIPSRFLIYRLNHSAMVPKLEGPTGI